MAERITITIVAEDGASQTFHAVAESASEAGESAEGTGESISDLTGALGALGIALSVEQIAAWTAAMVQAGAATNRQTFALRELTGTQAPEFMTAMSEATHGLLDEEDAAVISSRLLAQGIISTKEEAAEMARTATILGAAYGDMDPSAATEQLGMMLNTMNVRQVKDFGINVEVMRARLEELKGTMSDQDAFRMAFFEQAAPMAERMTGVLDDQQAHLDAWAVAWENAGEAVGTAMSKIADPAVVQATEVLNAALDDGNRIALEGKSAWEQRLFIAQQVEEAHRAEADAQRELFRESERNTGAIEHQTAAVQNNSAALEEQAGLQIKLLQNIGQLQAQAQTQAGVFQMGQQAIADMNIPLAQQMMLIEDLGLATGQLTGNQIAWSNELRQLQNLMVEGKLTVDGYKAGMDALATSTDGAHAATTALIKSITDKHGAIADSDIGDKQLIKNLNDARSSTSAVEEEMRKAQAAREALNNAPPTQIKVDQGQVDAANAALEYAKQQLAELDGKQITVGINYVASGDIPTP